LIIIICRVLSSVSFDYSYHAYFLLYTATGYVGLMVEVIFSALITMPELLIVLDCTAPACFADLCLVKL